MRSLFANILKLLYSAQRPATLKVRLGSPVRSRLWPHRFSTRAQAKIPVWNQFYLHRGEITFGVGTFRFCDSDHENVRAQRSYAIAGTDRRFGGARMAWRRKRICSRSTCQNLFHESQYVGHLFFFPKSHVQLLKTCLHQRVGTGRRKIKELNRHQRRFYYEGKHEWAWDTPCTTDGDTIKIGIIRTCYVHSSWPTTHRVESPNKEWRTNHRCWMRSKHSSVSTLFLPSDESQRSRCIYRKQWPLNVAWSLNSTE